LLAKKPTNAFDLRSIVNPRISGIRVSFLIAALGVAAVQTPLHGDEESKKSGSTIAEGISSNPAAVDIRTGTGELAEKLEGLFGLPQDTGVFLGGVWVGNTNGLLSGGAKPGKWSFNSLLNIGATLDANKLVGWKGGTFGVQFLQFNGQPTNEQAGSVQGYNSLEGPEPLNRSQLNELWWRQALFNEKLILRIGKVVPTYDFNNVLRPVPTQDVHLRIPAVSGLLYTPVFKNATLIGAMSGSYNPACGITTTIAPMKNVYFSYGIYDGNTANGVQTGLTGPHFNGYYFHIAEAGAAWEVAGLPGSFGAGGWRQTGRLSLRPQNNTTEDGASGFYLFGSQRFWRARPNIDNSGISGFVQFGVNNSETLPINEYFGLGLTEFGLVPNRPRDSAGVGLACSWLNPNIFKRDSESIFQAYYQAHITHGAYFEPAITYIPTPGANPKLDAALALSLTVICLF
jgi:porin